MTGPEIARWKIMQITQKLFDFASKVQVKLTPNAGGLLFVPLEARDKAPGVVIPNNEYIGNTVTIAAETKELEGLIAYLQKLGMNRGKWRDVFEPQQLEVTPGHATALSPSGLPMAGLSMSGGASAVMESRATGTAPLRRSCIGSGREALQRRSSSSG